MSKLKARPSHPGSTPKPLKSTRKTMEAIDQNCQHLVAREMALKEFDPEIALNYPTNVEMVWPEDENPGNLRVPVPHNAEDCLILAIDVEARIAEIDSKLSQDSSIFADTEEERIAWKKRTTAARFFLFRELAFLSAWVRISSFRLYRQMLELGLADAEGVKPSMGLANARRAIDNNSQALAKERAKRHASDRVIEAWVKELANHLNIDLKDVPPC